MLIGYPDNIKRALIDEEKTIKMRLRKIIRLATIVAVVFIFGAFGTSWKDASAETENNSNNNKLQNQNNTRQRHRDGSQNPSDEQFNKKPDAPCDPDNANKNRYKNDDKNNSNNNKNSKGNKNKGNKNKGNKNSNGNNKGNNNNGNKPVDDNSQGKGKGKIEVKTLNN